MSGVSVLMPAYNAEAYVREAVESILNQTTPPREFIVVDDGSTDGTNSILKEFSDRITLITQENTGQTGALNRALAVASCDRLAFHDADDIWESRKLELQGAVLDRQADCHAVFGLMQQFVSPDVPEDQQSSVRPAQELLPGEMRACMLIRRREFDRVGPFDPAIRNVSFIEWLGRAKRLGLNSVMLNEVVVRRRLHLGNYGRTRTASYDREMMAALRTVILQRRKQRAPDKAR